MIVHTPKYPKIGCQKVVKKGQKRSKMVNFGVPQKSGSGPVFFGLDVKRRDFRKKPELWITGYDPHFQKRTPFYYPKGPFLELRWPLFFLVFFSDMAGSLEILEKNAKKSGTFFSGFLVFFRCGHFTHCTPPCLWSDQKKGVKKGSQKRSKSVTTGFSHFGKYVLIS